ncbi:F-box protein At3g12350-like isoform X1 [Chenopodium quinoa]|uniref:F-box protein At3g12350-like isoform X1 n=1 Tax=Chenopodium quinoa TaxID=63459 RepID=UPI000B77EB2B|nr:F-box protein At3g12350-like isoform X1 [Chenopodium quinoa]
MANCSEMSAFTFSDFPEDVQLCILSFLTPTEISAFACTSKRFISLFLNGGVWYAMCGRRWGSKTQIRKWGDGKIGFKLLYKTLSEYENLVGFWRRSGGIAGGGIFGDAPLVFFEWGESCVTGSRLTPSKDGSYNVIKSPFIRLSLSADGQPLNYLINYTQYNEKELGSCSSSSSGMDLIQVNVNFMGKGHVVLEESNWNCGNSVGSPNGNGNGNKNFDNVIVGSPEVEIGSPPDRMMSEMYQYFANRTSPGAGGERAWRRQRRREKERQGRRKWEPEHLVKIVNCSPSPSRPLQGLWKGINDDMSLDFYLVAYDDIGGVACRRVGDSLQPLSGYAPVFWTSNATFIESPLSHEEDYVYNTRMHLRPTAEVEDDIYEYSPSRVMYINSSYNLIIPNSTGSSTNPRHVEGRIWQYVDGSFGFGFLRNNFIVDMKHIAQDDYLLDAAEVYCG